MFPFPPARPRWITRYVHLICTICGLTNAYCKGHGSAPIEAEDGAESDLSRRIREAREKQGGR